MADRMTTTPVTNDVSVETKVLADKLRALASIKTSVLYSARTTLIAAADALATRPAITAGTDAGAITDLEEAIRYAEIGEYLYSARAYSGGDGYTEPREYGIEWQWQQSKPDEYGQGALLAASTAWHKEQAEAGIVTEATKLRAAITPETAEAVPVAAQPGDAVREALEPFAEAADKYDPPEDDDHLMAWGCYFTLGQMRQARAALASVPAPAGDDVREALETARDYISDAAGGTLKYEDSGEGFKSMASEDLARIDAALYALSQPKEPRT